MKAIKFLILASAIIFSLTANAQSSNDLAKEVEGYYKAAKYKGVTQLSTFLSQDSDSWDVEKEEGFFALLLGAFKLEIGNVEEKFGILAIEKLNEKKGNFSVYKIKISAQREDAYLLIGNGKTCLYFEQAMYLLTERQK